jgi:hypothetical protein
LLDSRPKDGSDFWREVADWLVKTGRPDTKEAAVRAFKEDLLQRFPPKLASMIAVLFQDDEWSVNSERRWPMPYFQTILPDIVKHFTSDSAKRRLRLLIENNRQVEGWFKGELMVVFSESRHVFRQNASLSGWEPEVTYEAKKKYGFVVRPAGNREHLIGIEVKTGCPGRQYRRTLREMAQNIPFADWTLWHLRSVITGGHGANGGILLDAKRLRYSMVLGEGICLLFAYGKNEYVQEVASFSEQLRQEFETYHQDTPELVTFPDGNPILHCFDNMFFGILPYRV